MLNILILFGISLIPFLVAYLFYAIIFMVLRRVWRRHEGPYALVKSLEKPFLFIFLELAAFASLQIYDLKAPYEDIASHILLVIIILTFGWAAISATSALYHYIRDKHKTEALEDFARRSFLTRSQILYRAVLFVIMVLTFAAIIMTFPEIRNFGIGILGSAGVAGLAIGLAARPILTNLIAGFQIAFTRTLKIGDAVMVEGEYGFIENIFLTHVIVKTWDLRRIFVPLANFIDKSYINYSSHSTELLASAFLFCDYTAPIDAIRTKFHEVIGTTPLWNKVVAKVEVIELTERAMKLRFLMSAANPSDASNLQSFVREKMTVFLQESYPHALPQTKIEL